MSALRSLLRLLGVYKIYEKWLEKQVRGGEMPRHVGVILDGNRRWAVRHGLKTWMGHRAGAEKVKDLLRWCHELGIKTVTIYTFSTENFNRPEEEKREIMRILEEKIIEAMRSEDIHKRRIRIKFIGDMSMLDPSLVEKMRMLEDATKDYDGMIVNVAVAYGGKHEILTATRRIAEKVLRGELRPEDITYEVFQQHLYTSHLEHQDVDMVLRTGGEMRLSNFLLWQSAYSELIFLDVYWPEFRKIDLMRAIRTYQKRHRRFGR
ncbi:di-trans,poly-cis-decaprenylcistransferase [Candidatus Geothermarchaeota archaeon ex4572_27]|nr:MAG: di-trans,poly-cis-decaprenylcistransferase [Candidatus Geothermarchaeota archaeon ex4572_27]